MLYNPNYYSWGPEGWRCPECGRVYSPTTPMCFYCSNKEGTVLSTGTGINDSKWWEEYLKQSQTGKPVDDNPSTTTSTTNIDPNAKTITWNNMGTGHIEVGKDGSIMWKGPVPEIHYPSTLQEWFEVFNNEE